MSSNHRALPTTQGTSEQQCNPNYQLLHPFDHFHSNIWLGKEDTGACHAPAPTLGIPRGTKPGLSSSSHCRHHPHYCLQTILSPAAATSPLHRQLLSSHTSAVCAKIPEQRKQNRVHFLCKINGNELKLKTQSKNLCLCPRSAIKVIQVQPEVRIQNLLCSLVLLHMAKGALCSGTHRQFDMRGSTPSTAQILCYLFLPLQTAFLHLSLLSH